MAHEHEARERQAAPILSRDADRTPEDARHVSNRAVADMRGGPHGVMNAATAGPAARLPHKAALERTFGRRLDDVRAFVGRAQLSQMGAAAATRGTDVAFADREPDVATAAHEVAHALQNAGEGATPGPELSRPGDRAETEAGRAATAAEAGQPFAVTAAPTAAISRVPPDELLGRVGAAAKGAARGFGGAVSSLGRTIKNVGHGIGRGIAGKNEQYAVGDAPEPASSKADVYNPHVRGTSALKFAATDIGLGVARLGGMPVGYGKRAYEAEKGRQRAARQAADYVVDV